MGRNTKNSMTDATCCRVADRRIPALFIDNAFRRLFSPPERLLSKHLTPGSTAADLGCGPGFFTLPMAKIVGEGGVVHAVDFDPKAIEHIQKRASKRGYGRSIVPRTASAAEIDFIESNSIDFVLAEGLLCCMQDHEGAVRQIRRILKPDGRAYLSVVRFSPPGDSRWVSKDEWTSLLAEFRVLDGGESAMHRWALVTRNDDGGNKDDLEIESGRTLDPVGSR